MLDQALRELFEQQTAAAEPPVRANVERAAREGRALRRRRRAGVFGTPLFAAGAVAAIALATAIAPGQLSSHASRSGAAAKPQAPLAPRRFNPQDTYADFGWLPAGASLISGYTTPESIGLQAVKNVPVTPGSSVSGYAWVWTLYARGQCHTASGLLVCGGQSVVRFTGPAQAVGGQPAYSGYGPQYAGGPINVPENLAPHLLAYRFAGSWATLGAAIHAGLVRVARSVRITVPTKVSYPVHLTGVPASWRIASTSWVPGPAGPYSDDLAVRVSATWNLDVNAVPGAYLPCQGTPAVVAGHHVRLSQDASSPVNYTLCTPKDAGFFVKINETGQIVPGVIALFRSHLRLLGVNPAGWTTNPLN